VPAYQRALGLLVRREHSATELKRKLRGKGVEADALDSALETLQRQGFQDDRRYAEALVRSRALAGHGPVRIRAELRMNGVPGADIDGAFEAAEGDGLDWAEIAGRVAARFGPGLHQARGGEGLKLRHRAIAFLLRRGFSQEQARATRSGSMPTPPFPPTIRRTLLPLKADFPPPTTRWHAPPLPAVQPSGSA
jgi:regulatory protein